MCESRRLSGSARVRRQYLQRLSSFTSLRSKVMVFTEHLHLKSELESRVLSRTSRRVRNLRVELQPGRVVLSGHATSYYVKQLAQHGIREILPYVNLENSIAVGNGPLDAA